MSAALTSIAVDIGAPIIANILRNRAGSSGRIAASAIDNIAERLGTERTEAAIVQQYQDNPAATSEILRQVETGYAEIATAMGESTQSYHQLLAGDRDSPSLLNRLWRPFNGFLFGVEVMTIIAVVAIAILRGQVETLQALQPLWGFLGSIMGTHAGVVGVYVWRRSDEKLGSRA